MEAVTLMCRVVTMQLCHDEGVADACTHADEIFNKCIQHTSKADTRAHCGSQFCRPAVTAATMYQLTNTERRAGAQRHVLGVRKHPQRRLRGCGAALCENANLHDTHYLFTVARAWHAWPCARVAEIMINISFTCGRANGVHRPTAARPTRAPATRRPNIVECQVKSRNSAIRFQRPCSFSQKGLSIIF